VLDDRQPQPRAADGAVAGTIDPIEPLEHARELFAGNADAVVDDVDSCFPLFDLAGDDDLPARRRVLDGVVDEVVENRP
jgi:hypothetical protein